MKTLRIYGEQHAGQWVLMCLDYDLAVQDSALPAARRKLIEQIEQYQAEARGVDAAHQSALLSRRSPAWYWVKFYTFMVLQAVAKHMVRKHYTHTGLPAALSAA